MNRERSEEKRRVRRKAGSRDQRLLSYVQKLASINMSDYRISCC
jgi:hypothetical protein